MPGLDVGGLARIVAQRLTQLLDAGGERVVPHGETAPYPLGEHLLGDDVLGMFDQDCQDGRGPRREPGFGVRCAQSWPYGR